MQGWLHAALWTCARGAYRAKFDHGQPDGYVPLANLRQRIHVKNRKPLFPISDARTLSQGHLDGLRRLMVDLYAEGLCSRDIARLLGVSYECVRTALQRYKRGGESSIKPHHRGRPRGYGRSLDPAQEQDLRQKITANLPAGYGIPSGLWSIQAVGLLIQQETGLTLSLNSTRRYLDRWGLHLPVPPRPNQLAPQWAYLKNWMSSKYPRIALRASDEGAEIYWLLRTPISSPAPSSAKTSAPPPEPAGDDLMELTGLANNRGRSFWMVGMDTPEVSSTIACLETFLNEVKHKVLVLLPMACSTLRHALEQRSTQHHFPMQVAFVPGPANAPPPPDPKFARDVGSAPSI